ncbi:MAG TPA: hypothetical protein VIK74_06005 [Parasegetibacter sp.]
MKKLSVSLFAVLAIAFALTSAFTTKSNKIAPDTRERFGVQVDQVAFSGATASQVNANKILDQFRLAAGLGAISTSIDSEIDAFNDAHVDEMEVSCATDTEKVCAAIIEYNGTPSSELALVDFNAGDYSLTIE